MQKSGIIKVVVNGGDNDDYDCDVDVALVLLLLNPRLSVKQYRLL